MSQCEVQSHCFIIHFFLSFLGCVKKIWYKVKSVYEQHENAQQVLPQLWCTREEEDGPTTEDNCQITAAVLWLSVLKQWLVQLCTLFMSISNLIIDKPVQSLCLLSQVMISFHIIHPKKHFHANTILWINTTVVVFVNNCATITLYEFHDF